MSAKPQFCEPYTISRLNAEVRALLEAGLPLLWVEGEVSNLARPASGHLYFSLKDERAQVRCAMFRNRAGTLPFRPADGIHVLVRARVSLYEPRGDFQLIVEHMEEAGHGALMRAFEALKARLAAEGLFDEARKRPLPAFPRRVGVVTSETGAALRDILHVLARRFPALPVLVFPVPAQGEGAAERIAAAIRKASQTGGCDVLIVARGGGSIEDLWAFNEEVVARAIRDSAIPVVTGIGHETDFTIADFAADLRAPTPSAAAAAVSPDGAELAARAAWMGARLQEGLRQRLSNRSTDLERLSARIARLHPLRRLQQQAQRIDELDRRFRRTFHLRLRQDTMQVEGLQSRMQRLSPERALGDLRDRLDRTGERNRAAIAATLIAGRTRLAGLARTLHAVSPLATLERGYSILTTEDGRVLRDAARVREGDEIEARLAHGRLGCRVTRIG